jgi:hypothetical protein
LPHQGLQHRLEMPRRQFVPKRQRFSSDRPAIRVQGDVNDCCDGENTFARQQWHASPG